MPSLYSVGCAYVFVGAWSYLVAVSPVHASLFELNGCHLTATSANSTIICLTKNSKYYEKDFRIDVAMCNIYVLIIVFWMQLFERPKR